jgi:hypothetical protein
MMAISGSFHVQTLCKKSSRRMDPIFGRSDHLRPLGKIWTSFKGWKNLWKKNMGTGRLENGKTFFGNMMFSHDGNMMMIEVF